jgi:hypothetical protein
VNDLPVFFAARDFGVAENSVTWRGAHVTGIFEDKDVEVATGEGVAQIVRQPVFTSSSSQFPGIADGDAFVTDGIAYLVKNWKDDGSGVIEIYLERDNA